MSQVTVNLHAGQKQIIAERKRFNTVACGRRFGKTRLAFGLALETISAGQNVVYVTPTATDYDKRWKEAESTFHRLTNHVSKDSGTMRFANGRTLEFYGLHRYDAARGNRYGRAIFDEAAFSDNLADAWSEVFRPTLVDFKGDAYFFSTPNWQQDPPAFKRFFDTDHPDWMRWQMPTTANPFIDPAEVEAARLDPNTPEIKFRQEYLAEFVDASGALVDRSYIKYYHTLPDGCSLAMGVDLAISTRTSADYSAIVVVALAPDNSIYVVDYWRGHTSFHETQEKIKSLAARYNPTMVLVESVAYQVAMVQELVRTTQIPVRQADADRDKVSRFMPVLGKLEHGLVYFPQNAKELVDELLSFPDGKHDDMVDALVYAIRATERGFWFG